jgi:SAM-dependent methyltransferase
MNVVQRVIKSLRMAGVGGTMAKLVCPYFDRKFDRDHGTETCVIEEVHALQIESANRAHSARYEPSRVLPLRKMFPIVRRMMPPESVLLDFGCGKGRVLLLAAEHGFGARGIEFAGELCEVARRNVATFNARTGNKSEITVIKGDVTEYVIRPDETVFFLFNPFGPVIFEKVLDQLCTSLKAHPRKILIVICLPSDEYHCAVEARSEFKLQAKHRFWGCNFAVYSSRV